MNRQLKFRVWTGITMEHKIMVGHLGAFYCAGLNPEDTASLSAANTKYDDINPVMQFTGLTDSKDNEIYEADIVTYDHHEGIAIVKWDEDDGSYYLDGDTSWIDLFSDKRRWYRCEVVGNIYQNKKLLCEN
jgi:uncharacterized phage protein (TIGR01671 family)